MSRKRKNASDEILTSERVAGIVPSTTVTLGEDCIGFSVSSVYTDTSSGISAKTFDSDTKEVIAITCPAENAVKEVTEITCPAENAVKEVTEITCPAENSAKEVTEITCIAENGVKELSTITCIDDTSEKEETTIVCIDDNSVREKTTIACVDEVGEQEETTITCVAENGIAESYTVRFDDGGDIADNDYFTFNSALDVTAYYVWYEVDGAGGVDPAPGGTGIKVNILSTDTANQVAIATRTAILATASADVAIPVVPVSDTLTITNTRKGATTNAAVGVGMGVMFLVTVSVAGVTSSYFGTASTDYNGKYFTINTAADAIQNYVWFDVDNTCTDPAPGGGLVGVEVDIAGGDTATQVAVKVAAALDALAGYSAPVPITADAVITNAKTGVTTNAANVDVGGAFSISTTNDGVDSYYSGKYFTIKSALNATSYYVWYNVNSESTDPAPGGTGIQVNITLLDSKEDIATATALALDNLADFIAAAPADENVVVETYDYGATTDSANVDVGGAFTVTKTTDGVTSAYNSKYFTIKSALDAISYYVWFNVHSQGVDPAPGGTGIEVAIAAAATKETIAIALAAALDLNADFVAPVPADENVVVTNAKYGASTDAANVDVGGAFSVTVTNQGVTSPYNSKYLTMYSALDAVAYYLWFNVSSEGVDPAPGGKTAIPVAISALDTKETIATAIASAIDSLADFVAPAPAAEVVAIANAKTGATTNIANVDVGGAFSVATSQAGVTSSYNGKYFTINTALDAIANYVWFSTNSEGVDPAPGGKVGIKVDTAIGDTDAQVATKVASALDALAGYVAPAPGAAVVTVTNAKTGATTDAANVDVGGAFSISVTTPGVTSVYNGKYFTINTALDAITNYVWFNLASEGTDPAPGGKVGIEVAIAIGDSANTVADKVASALDALDGYVAPNPAADVVTVTNAKTGATTNAANVDVGAGFSISVTTAGVTSVLNSKYFTINTALDAIQNYVWFNTASEGVDPAPGGGKVGVEVATAIGDTNAQVATKLAAALDALAGYVAPVPGAAVVAVTNAKSGATTNAANVDVGAGFSISVTVAGVTSVLNSKYFTFSSADNTTDFYGWFNTASEGTDPAVAGRTGVEIATAIGNSADDVADAVAAALNALAEMVAPNPAAAIVTATEADPGVSTDAANVDVGAGFSVAISIQGRDTEINLTNNTATIPSHGYVTGTKGQLTTDGTLPAGLSLLTNYYIIKVDANTVKFASSTANAYAGTAVDMTDEGTGTHTFTPNATLASTIKLQASNDGTNWDDLTYDGTNAITDTISAASYTLFNSFHTPYYLYLRLLATTTSGEMTITTHYETFTERR